MAEGEEADFFHGEKADVSRFALSNPKLGLEQGLKCGLRRPASCSAIVLAATTMTTARRGNPIGRCRLLAAEGGIRAVLLKRRLDEALRLMLAANKEERSLTDIARCCGLGGTSQFRRAFRARFGMPPRHR
jgi:AraC-like DNA-binding protein